MRWDDSIKEHGALNAGLDEVGMGSLAGPICVAVTAFDFGPSPVDGVDDSKKLTFKQRMKLAPLIMKKAAFFNIGWAHPTVIDDKGVAEAWQRACLDALEGLPPSKLYIDGANTVTGYKGEQQAFVKGDSFIWQISAASIVAKSARDLEMIGMGKHYPQYGWGRNMGYGSKEHIKALLKFGPCPYHRGRYLVKFYRKFKREIKPSLWKKWEERWLDAKPEDIPEEG
jgi:ribonuclease HII